MTQGSRSSLNSNSTNPPHTLFKFRSIFFKIFPEVRRAAGAVFLFRRMFFSFVVAVAVVASTLPLPEEAYEAGPAKCGLPGEMLINKISTERRRTMMATSKENSDRF